MRETSEARETRETREARARYHCKTVLFPLMIRIRKKIDRIKAERAEKTLEGATPCRTADLS